MRAPPESLSPIDGHARLHGEIHHLADLPGVGLREGPTEDREILGEDEDRPAVNAPGPGHHPVPENPLFFHAEVVALVDHELVQLHEGPGVQEQDSSRSRAVFLPALCWRRTRSSPPPSFGLPAAAAELLEALLRDMAWDMPPADYREAASESQRIH